MMCRKCNASPEHKCNDCGTYFCPHCDNRGNGTCPRCNSPSTSSQDQDDATPTSHDVNHARD